MTNPSEYAEQLEEAIAAATAFCDSCSPEEWATVVAGENWAVGVVVHHAALGHDLVMGWIDCALTGRPIEDTAEAMDEENLRHAGKFAGVGVEETVELLRTKGAAAARKLRGLNGDDLDKTTSFGPAGGHPFSVEQFCIATVAHVQTHLSHARQAVGRVEGTQ